MDVRTLLSAAAVAAVLAAGASTASGAAPGSRNGESVAEACDSGSCIVTITVDGCAGASIRPDIETIYVARGNSPVMHWKIAQSSFMMGWQFADQNGIFFKNSPAGEFTLNGNGPKLISFNNRHAPADQPNGVKHEYGINIVKRGGSPGSVSETCPTKDPWVHNL